jgi:hypothetical protein
MINSIEPQVDTYLRSQLRIIYISSSCMTFIVINRKVDESFCQLFIKNLINYPHSVKQNIN